MEQQMNSTRHTRRQRGVSLIETMVVTSTAAVLTGIVAPGFDGALQRRHLEGAAAQLETDVHHTRMLAVARNAPLRISFESGSGGSCYVIHTGTANQCSCSSGTAVCSGAASAERVAHFDSGAKVAVASNTRSVLFDPQRGTSSPTATVRLVAQNGNAIHQVVNIMGRVRSCTPAPLPGYKRC
jgi:type IV fimbrial biogenesis protein FimT